jgi:hypothetical protein
MPCSNAVRWLCQVAVSGILVSGCLVEAESTDPSQWGRDEAGDVDFDQSLKPESFFLRHPDDADNTDDGAETGGTQQPDRELPGPSTEVDGTMIQDQEKPAPTQYDGRPTPKDDPQPEPQKGIKVSP